MKLYHASRSKIEYFNFQEGCHFGSKFSAYEAALRKVESPCDTIALNSNKEIMYRKTITKEGVSKHTKEYSLWKGMRDRIRKGISGSYVSATYCDVEISDKFKDFQFFAEWCNKEPGFRGVDISASSFQLDKDLLSLGKPIYSEDTCCFIPAILNTHLRGSYKKKETPCGVYKRDSGYEVAGRNSRGEYKYLGTYKDLIDATRVATLFKNKTVGELVRLYEPQMSSKAIERFFELFPQQDCWEGYEFALEEFHGLGGEDE